MKITHNHNNVLVKVACMHAGIAISIAIDLFVTCIHTHAQSHFLGQKGGRTVFEACSSFQKDGSPPPCRESKTLLVEMSALAVPSSQRTRCLHVLIWLDHHTVGVSARFSPPARLDAINSHLGFSEASVTIVTVF